MKLMPDTTDTIEKTTEHLLTEKKIPKRKKTTYHHIFDQATDAIFITDFKGDFIDVNDSLCRMFGYTKKELLRLNISALIEPEHLRSRPIDFGRLSEGHHIFNERFMVNRDGDVLVVEANVKRCGDNMILVIVRDVTELRKAQALIHINEARFRGAFEHSAIGMAIVSVKGEWLKVNRELCRITGYSEQELLSLTFQQITYPDDLGKDLLFMEQALKGEIEFYAIEKRYVHKNGSILWIKLNVSLVRNDQSTPHYFVSQIENITDRKKAETALIRRNEGLEEFAHILSHNVRSHVARLLGLANLLNDCEIDESEKREVTAGIAQSANSLDEAVRNLNNILQNNEP